MVSNTNNKFVLISDPIGDKSISLLCFRQEDAEAFLAQACLQRREWKTNAKVVPINLDQVYLLKVEGISFRFLPNPIQIKNALESFPLFSDPGDMIDPVEQLVSLTRNCCLIEHLFIETYSLVVLPPDSSSTLVEFVDNSPNLTSLSLLRSGVNDAIAQTIIKGFRQLKHVNLSQTTRITGCFLRGLGLSSRDSPLETLIMRNCYGLKEREVLLFLNSLFAGDFKSIRLIDVSSDHGLVTDGGDRTFEPIFLIEELRKQIAAS